MGAWFAGGGLSVRGGGWDGAVGECGLLGVGADGVVGRGGMGGWGSARRLAVGAVGGLYLAIGRSLVCEWGGGSVGEGGDRGECRLVMSGGGLGSL